MPDPLANKGADGAGRAGDLLLFRVTTADLDHTVAARDKAEALALLRVELGWDEPCFRDAEVEAVHPKATVRLPVGVLIPPAVRHWLPASCVFYASDTAANFLNACDGRGRVLMTPGWGE